MNKIQIQNTKKWVKALKSGNYEQAKNFLRTLNKRQSGNYGYCCLGLACELNNNLKGRFCKISGSVGGPDDNWFETTFGFSIHKHNFAEMNDTENKSFKEIAEYIEKNILNKQPKRNKNGRFVTRK